MQFGVPFPPQSHRLRTFLFRRGRVETLVPFRVQGSLLCTEKHAKLVDRDPEQPRGKRAPLLVVFRKVCVHIEKRAADRLVGHLSVSAFRQQEFIDHGEELVIKLDERGLVCDGESCCLVPICASFFD